MAANDIDSREVRAEVDLLRAVIAEKAAAGGERRGGVYYLFDTARSLRVVCVADRVSVIATRHTSTRIHSVRLLSLHSTLRHDGCRRRCWV